MPNHFDDGLCLRHFKIIKITFEIVCDEIGVLVSSDIPLYDLLRQSQLFQSQSQFLLRIKEFIR